MTTAGSEGFLNLMPIYLDHILYPTLTVSAVVLQINIEVIPSVQHVMYIYCSVLVLQMYYNIV